MLRSAWLGRLADTPSDVFFPKWITPMFDRGGKYETAAMIHGCGPLQGPSYTYRDAVIDGNASGTLFRIALAGSLIDGWKGLCSLSDALRLVDAGLARSAH